MADFRTGILVNDLYCLVICFPVDDRVVGNDIPFNVACRVYDIPVTGSGSRQRFLVGIVCFRSKNRRSRRECNGPVPPLSVYRLLVRDRLVMHSLVVTDLFSFRGIDDVDLFRCSLHIDDPEVVLLIYGDPHVPGRDRGPRSLMMQFRPGFLQFALNALPYIGDQRKTVRGNTGQGQYDRQYPQVFHDGLPVS